MKITVIAEVADEDLSEQQIDEQMIRTEVGRAMEELAGYAGVALSGLDVAFGRGVLQSVITPGSSANSAVSE